MPNKKFSVIMPLYNHELYVSEAITSVLNQDYSNFELIICNDGSTDNSFELAQSFKDDRITLINKPNGGTVSALNACIMESSGDFICWLSSDDYYSDEKLSYHLFAHSNNNTLLSIAPSASFRDNKKTKIDLNMSSGSSRMLSFFGKNPINGLAICAHREMYLKYGLFNPRYKYSHDYERWLCFLKYEEPLYVDGSPQSFTRLGTSFVEDNNPFVLGVLDNIKVLTRLLSNGLEYFVPDGFPISEQSLDDLLKYFFSLSNASNNYFYRYGLSEIYIKSLSTFILKYNAIHIANDIKNSDFHLSSSDVQQLIDECLSRIRINDIKQDPFLFVSFLKSLSNSSILPTNESKGVGYYINDCFC
jgi:glycosyltransferase involved in cell wall biosynthesis